jgi:hypothetical protein
VLDQLLGPVATLNGPDGCEGHPITGPALRQERRTPAAHLDVVLDRLPGPEIREYAFVVPTITDFLDGLEGV